MDMGQAMHKQLQEKIKSPIRFHEPLSSHTSWRIGGSADIFLSLEDEHDLRQAIIYAHQKGLPVTIIGNGTNLLISDRGIRGMVLKMGSGLSKIDLKGKLITAGAGASLPRLAKMAMQSGVAGFEYLAGIPGTVGGALVMNAGANDSAMGELVKQVMALDYAGSERSFDARELAFTYRQSCLARRNIIITRVVFESVPGQREAIKKRMECYLDQRRKAQPLEFPNAGCVFKNPPGDSAGRLIELAGCKEMQVGAIQVSPQHANFFVNLGGGVARDVITLVERVQRLVEDKFGVELVLEVQKLGEF